MCPSPSARSRTIAARPWPARTCSGALAVGAVALTLLTAACGATPSPSGDGPPIASASPEQTLASPTAAAPTLASPTSAAPTASASAAQTTTPPPEPAPGAEPDGCTRTESYTVAAGDSLSGIAGRYGLTVDELVAANPHVDDPNLIYVGDELEVPIVTVVGTLGGRESRANAINEPGEIVGTSDLGAPNEYHAFYWYGGVMTDLGTLGGLRSQATDINDAGQVVGTSTATTELDAPWRAVLWDDGAARDLGTLGGPSAMAVAINAHGDVVGDATLANGLGRGFIWQDGRMSDLGTLGGVIATVPTAINDRGQVVGAAFTAAGEQHAFLWERGRMVDLGTLGGSWSFAHDINELGQVVGVSSLEGEYEGPKRAFLWQDGVMTDLGTLGGADSMAVAINERGEIVGRTIPLDASARGLLWADGRVTDLGVDGQRESALYALNDRGQVVGTCLARWSHAVLVQVRPTIGVELGEPSPDTAVPQDDASTGCPAHGTRGYGFQVTFSWSARLLQNVGQYRLVVSHGAATTPALDVTLTEDRYWWPDCNAFVADSNLTGWHWRVSALDFMNNVIAISEPRPLQFLPCRLADGSACNAPG
jgi:probable HAF family extracellular repeat protein